MKNRTNDLTIKIQDLHRQYARATTETARADLLAEIRNLVTLRGF